MPKETFSFKRNKQTAVKVVVIQLPLIFGIAEPNAMKMFLLSASIKSESTTLIMFIKKELHR